VQPFISGALSKTVNMPNECTVEDIMTAYTESWKLGIKALAVYRDGSKRSQPLNTSLDKLKDTTGKNGEAAGETPRLQRRRLSDERAAITHKFSISGHEGYLTVGLYEDGTPGEIFVTMAKEGSAVSGLVDAVATLTSITLQYGVPMEVLCRKFIHTRFEPNGFTNNPNIPMAKSILDYIFRWLELKFVLPKESASSETQSETLSVMGDGPRAASGPKPAGMPVAFAPAVEAKSKTARKTQVAFQVESDAPPCPECGDIMVRSGSCHKCISCGTTSGCS
jgi:ribonucleoside-diphosphate reductase alpha chain